MENQGFTGSCLCGARRFRVEGPALSFQYCHCSRCRKVTGSAHAALMFIPAAQFQWLAGETGVRRFELSTAKHFCNAFCETCGAQLPWPTRNGKVVAVPAGALDDDPGIKPSRNVYVASRAAWAVAAGELESHDEGPPR